MHLDGEAQDGRCGPLSASSLTPVRIGQLTSIAQTRIAAGAEKWLFQAGWVAFDGSSAASISQGSACRTSQVLHIECSRSKYCCPGLSEIVLVYDRRKRSQKMLQRRLHCSVAGPPIGRVLQNDRRCVVCEKVRESTGPHLALGLHYIRVLGWRHRHHRQVGSHFLLCAGVAMHGRGAVYPPANEFSGLEAEPGPPESYVHAIYCQL